VVHEKGIFEWRKGSLPPVKRVACGGTDFRVACDYINDGKAGKVDGYIVITDGECSDPGHSKLRRAWVITPGHKLYFPTRELVINMDEKKAGKDSELR
jgi:predicted metal-dependent peptidase